MKEREKRREKEQSERKKKMAKLSPNISIITLNVNDLNIPTESQIG